MRAEGSSQGVLQASGRRLPVVDAACLRPAEHEALHADDPSDADVWVLEHQLTIDEPLAAEQGRSAIVLRADRPLVMLVLASGCARSGPPRPPVPGA